MEKQKSKRSTRILSGLLALASLLAVFRAPAKPLWFVAIAATEWGHWLAIASVILLFIAWRWECRWGATCSLTAFSALLFLSPLARASRVAQELPSQLAAVFGTAPTRSKPLNWVDLFTGVKSPGVRVTPHVYTTVDGRELSLDLYQPMHADHPLPGVIVIHGGSWQSGDRAEFQDLNRYLSARGYVVASIDYRMAPVSVFPAQRNDVYAAITYLKSHAAEFGLNKEKLVLLGRSAGGQIALSAAYAEKDSAIKGVIAFYAPNDLVWGYSVPANPLIMNSRKVIETYLGGPPAGLPGAYEAASPLNFVNSHTPPTLMIHGARDELVSPIHEKRLSQRLREAGRRYYYLRLPWATHGCDANFSGPSGQLSTYAVERFLAFVTQEV